MDETMRVPFESWKARPTPAALIALLEASRPLVYTLCHRVLRHPQDAEDASQLVLLHLIDKLGEIRDTTHYRHWIHRVCLHLSLNLKRSRNRRREHERERAGLVATATPADPADSVYDHLATLETESRTLLISRYFEQRSVQDLAASSGCSTVTLWKRLEKARDELLQSLVRSGLAMALPDLDGALDSSLPVATPGGGLSPSVLAKASAASSGASASATILAAGILKAKSLAAALLIGLAGATVLVTATWRSQREPMIEPGRVAAIPSTPTAASRRAVPESSGSLPSPASEAVTEAPSEPTLEQTTNAVGGSVLPSIIRFMKTQNEDGSWGDGKTSLGSCVIDRTGVTSLALLSFLGAGYCHLSKDTYEGQVAGASVRRALDHLLRGQREDGTFVTNGDVTMDQALTALAVSETYGTAGSPYLKDPAQKGIQALLKMQRDDGSWGNPLVTHWANEALASAQLNDLFIDAVVLERSKNYVRSQLEAGPSLQAMIGYIFLNRERTGPGLAQTSAMISAVPPDASRPDLLYCYLGSLALFQYEGPDGKTWKEWSRPLQRALVGTQQDGFWQGRTQSDTIVQSSLATLSLETVYRYGTVPAPIVPAEH